MTIDDAFARFPSLSTNRLLLRHIVPEDAEALFAIRSDEEGMKFFGHEPHESLDETKGVIRQMKDDTPKGRLCIGVSRFREKID